jgi:Na+/H+ antiporter NhaC
MTYEITSLLPPLIAIVLALVTRRVLFPLAAGILCGALLLAKAGPEGSYFAATATHFYTSVKDSITDHDHLMVLAFSILLGMLVGVIETAGSMQRAIAKVARRAASRRGVQTLIASTGLAVFFDDYANTLLVGGTMQSTSDRAGISREKLAYLVDSTAAPVAGLALVSTWVATELSYLQAGIDASAYGATMANSSVSVFDVFIQSVPYRFYPWFALALVFIIARTGRDFGPMRLAEQQAVLKHAEQTAGNAVTTEPTSSRGRFDIVAAIGPIFICIIAVLATLVVTGRGASEQTQTFPSEGFVSYIRWAGDVIGSGNSYLALVIGGQCGLIAAILLAVGLSRIGARQLCSGLYTGAMQMMPAMAVLWLAWALSAMTGKDALDTGGYLSSVLSDRIDIRLLPTCVFILAGGIAFATGTSWGTMAIVTPIAVSLVLDLQATSVTTYSSDLVVNSPLALATFSSVLAGAIFGDHCSPISDTTVLSSRASGCDHVQHVRTQMPYALLAGGVCIITGTLPVAFGVPVWVCLIAGIACLFAAIRRWGVPVSAT